MTASCAILCHQGASVDVVRFAPRGRMLAAGGADGSLHVWSVEVTPRPLGQAEHSAAVADVIYSPRLSLLVARTPEGLHGWAVPDVRATFEWHVGAVDDAVFLPDGNHVLVAGDGRLRILDLRDGQTVRESSRGAGRLAQIALDTRAACITTLWRESGAAWLETRSLDTLERVSAVPLAAAPRAFALAPDGARCALSNGRIDIIAQADGATPPLLEGSPSEAEATDNGSWSRAVFSAEGRLLVAGSPAGSIHVWDTVRGRTVFLLEGHEGPVGTVDLLHGQSTVASGGADGTVRLWSLARGRR